MCVRTYTYIHACVFVIVLASEQAMLTRLPQITSFSCVHERVYVCVCAFVCVCVCL